MLRPTSPGTLPSGVTVSLQRENLFCLCKSCATERNSDGECDHETFDETTLIVTWVIDEVRLAVQNSYEVIEIFEVYEYAVTQYDPQTGQGGFLIEYVDTILKLKTEASGYLEWVRTSEDEDRYISNFHDIDSIRLNKEAIRPNAAKRVLAKLPEFHVGQIDGKL